MPLPAESRVALSREDDRRIGALESQTALIAQHQQTLASSIGEIKVIVSGLDGKLDSFIERLIHEHAEAEATPAGRQMLRVTSDTRATLNGLSLRMDQLEQWRDEFRGSMATLRGASVITSLMSAAAIIISAAHAAHLL